MTSMTKFSMLTERKQAWQEAAKKEGLSLSAWVREACEARIANGTEPPDDEFDAAVDEMLKTETPARPVRHDAPRDVGPPAARETPPAERGAEDAEAVTAGSGLGAERAAVPEPQIVAPHRDLDDAPREIVEPFQAPRGAPLSLVCPRVTSHSMLGPGEYCRWCGGTA